MGRLLAIALFALATGIVVAVLQAEPAQPSSTVATCGVERWSVKTLTDVRAGLVRRQRVTTVDALRALRPSANASGLRAAPVETTIWSVRASLLASKIEADDDIHLVVAQPGRPTRTMIVEFPAPACTLGASSLRRTQMRAARASFIVACGQPSDFRFNSLTGTATISGVGFFDFEHRQNGVAPNAIELHPVLSFHASNCRSR
jgi:hypothetical protein